MPSIPIIVKQRHLRRSVHQARPTLRLGLISSVFISVLIAVAVLGLTWLYADVTRNLPSIEILPSLVEPPGGLLAQPTRFYDSSSQHIIATLRSPLAADSQYVWLDKKKSSHFPEVLVAATLTTADPRFGSHPGFLWEELTNNNHPTLAERLALNLLLWDEPPGLLRDLRQRLLAAQITSRYGNEKILEWYLNSARYGRMIYGADSAARAFYGKPVTEIGLAEAALLAAAAEAPDIDPRSSTEIVREHQALVLGAMASQGRVAASDAEKALKTESPLLPIEASASAYESLAPAYTDLALAQLEEHIPADRVERGGLRVVTSLNFELQGQVSCSARIQVEHLEGREAPSNEPTDCQASRLLTTLPVNPGSADLAAGAVITDPKTGQVLALTAEGDASAAPFGSTGRPAGSVLTPFIYLAAFTRGYSPASLVWDIPADLPEYLREDSSAPQAYKGPVNIRSAMANDYLAAAEQVLSQVGSNTTSRIASQLGIASLTQNTLETMLREPPLLSSGQFNLLEISQAYGVLANRGILAGALKPADPEVSSSALAQKQEGALEQVFILRVQDTNGALWFSCLSQGADCPLDQRPILSQELAYLVTHVLSDESARWPSLGHPNPLEVGRPAAAKIGQTADGQDSWTIGYTPNLVVGTWIGTARPPGSTGQKVQPAAASVLWHALLQYASQDLPPDGWSMPAGVHQTLVCVPSGMLPTTVCPAVANEIFLSGNDPTHGDTLYRSFQINRETGRLATVFTPPQLIENRVYLVTPPEAIDWARSTGMDIPPQEYDVVFSPLQLPGVQITTPVMFGSAGGKVSIMGSAEGNGFISYRLQVGQGLNPQEWIQIGSDVSQSVHQGKLGEWDTQGLSGLYALQLLVIRKDQRVDTAIIQVTVDNQPPTIRLVQPAADDQASLASRATWVFQAEAEDDISLSRVEFLVDGKEAASLTQGPFTVAWQAKPGKHTLTVRAVDQAKNTQETSVQFTVIP